MNALNFLSEINTIDMDNVSLIIRLGAAGIIVSSVLYYIWLSAARPVIRELIKQDALAPDRALSLKGLGFKNSPIYRWLLRNGSVLRKTIHVYSNDSQPPEDTTPEDTKSEKIKNGSNSGCMDYPESISDKTAALQNKNKSFDTDNSVRGDLVDNRKAAKKLSHNRTGKDKREKIDFDTVKLYIPAEISDSAELRFLRSNDGILSMIAAVVLIGAASELLIRFFPSLYQLFSNLMST